MEIAERGATNAKGSDRESGRFRHIVAGHDYVIFDEGRVGRVLYKIPLLETRP